MEQLDLLRNLEDHHNSLKLYRKELLILKNDSMIDKNEEKIVDTEKRLSRLKSSHENVKDKLRQANIRLKNYNFKIEEVEKNLYDGQIIDIKQLEYLNDEKDKLKEIISDTEIEILEFMDEVEDIDKELLIMERSLEEIKDKNNKIKSKYNGIEENLKGKIRLEENEIITLENKIDASLLNKYNLTKKNKGTGIAEVKDSVCSGCNMLIPTILIDKLNNQNEIIYCENCGRILCKL